MNFSRPIRGVVFDFDVTLVDSNHIKREAYDFAFGGITGAGRYITVVLRRFPSADRATAIRHIVLALCRAGIVSMAEAEALNSRAVRRYGSHCKTAVQDAVDFPDATASIRRLARKYTLAINSGTPQRQLRQLIATRPWGRHFRMVCGTPSTKVANLERIADRFRLRPDQLVLIGDSVVDQEAAAAFGCHFLFAAHQSRPPSAVPSVDRLRQLPRAIALLERDAR